MKNESMMNRHQSECWISDSAKHLHAGPRCKLVCSPCSWEPEAVGYSGTAEHCHNFALVWDKSDSCDSSSSQWSGHSWPGGTDGGVTTSHSEAFGPVHCPDNKSGLREGAVTTLGFPSLQPAYGNPLTMKLLTSGQVPLSSSTETWSKMLRELHVFPALPKHNKTMEFIFTKFPRLTPLPSQYLFKINSVRIWFMWDHNSLHCWETPDFSNSLDFSK